MTNPQTARPALAAVTSAPDAVEVSAPANASDTSPERTVDHGSDSGALAIAALTNELPEFATVMRGYDRGQVEDYVVRLQEFLHDAEVRAANADRRVTQGQRRVADLERELARAGERASSPAAVYDGLGERISTMLRLAAEEADGIRAKARDEADAMTDKTRSDCEQLRLAAEHELADIARRRDGVVSELNRVRDVLATLGLSQPTNITEGTAAQPPHAHDAQGATPSADQGLGASQETTVLNLADLKVAGQH